MGILITNSSTYYAAAGPHGNYRYISLTEILDSFRAAYVGKDKICERVLDNDITFHALRAIQELSYATLKSTKDWEVEIPSTLVLVMPSDYVNYIKLSWSDSVGTEHIIYPTSKTSNPKDIVESVTAWGGFDPSTGDTPDLDGTTDSDGNETSTTWTNYAAATPNEVENDDEDDIYWPHEGARFGLSPERSQVNGNFFIDEDQGKFHFSSNLAGKTVILRYISDGIVTAGINGDSPSIDMTNTLVPKLAEEAIYKHVLYGILLARKDTNPNLLMQIKRERFAETRKAKIRLSNIKIEEITQVLRGSSKIIKH